MEVAKLSRIALETTIDRLSALSLVDVHGGEERYALHPLTRTFVQSNLLTNETIARETGMRFAQYWNNYANSYGLRKYNTFKQLDVEWSNLEIAANWLWRKVNLQGKLVEDNEFARVFNELTSALSEFLVLYGRWDELIELNSYAYKIMYKMNSWNSAGECAYNLATIYQKRGHDDEATFWVEHCVKAWSQSNSKVYQGVSARMRGVEAEKNRDYDTARSLYQDTLTIFRDLGKDEWIAGLLNDLGDLAHKVGDLKSAEQRYREGFELAEKIGDKSLQTYIADSLGDLAWRQDQSEDAHVWFDHELKLAKDIGSLEGIANAKFGLALVQEDEGNLDMALSLAKEALKVYERLQYRNLAKVQKFVERLTGTE